MRVHPIRRGSLIFMTFAILIVFGGCTGLKQTVKSPGTIPQKSTAEVKSPPAESTQPAAKAESQTLASHPTQPAPEEEIEIPLSELPVAPAPSIRIPQTAREVKYRGQPMTLDFKDADLRDVLRMIVEINNFNLVLHPEVSGRVSIRLVNVPWDQALDTILKLHNLAVEIEGNVMRVGSIASFQREIEARRLLQEQRLKALEAQRKLEPLQTAIINLNFADPSQIISVIEGILGGRQGRR